MSLADVFEALTVLLGPLARKQNVRIETGVGPAVPILRTDPGKLQQILFNLIGNAIKFSPTDGRVDVVARREWTDDGEPADTILISVSDQGPGIAPEQQAIIFEKFRQIDAGKTRQFGGTGLGLSISRELATLLGGTLTVESTLGNGATFRLRLPIRLKP